MNEFMATKAPEPYQPLLFPQEFQTGEASAETFEEHIAFANWTIGALEDAIREWKDRTGERETHLKLDVGMMQGARRVLEQRIQ